MFLLQIGTGIIKRLIWFKYFRLWVMCRCSEQILTIIVWFVESLSKVLVAWSVWDGVSVRWSNERYCQTMQSPLITLIYLLDQCTNELYPLEGIGCLYWQYLWWGKNYLASPCNYVGHNVLTYHSKYMYPLFSCLNAMHTYGCLQTFY